jgi:flavin-dependent dehydrogenase
VAQIDRYAFPRLKPCGGGITIKSCKALPFELAPVLRGESQAIELNVWETRQNRFAHRSNALMRMVVRQDFDSWLVARNLERPGFQFFDGDRVLAVAYDEADGLFTIRTTKRVLRARHLVGADGAYSVVNKRFRVTAPKGIAVAVEVTLPRASTTLDRATPPCFDFGAIARGYGWVFPKDDHWNVGIYTLDKNTDLRGHLRRYIARKGFGTTSDPLATLAAHRFPYGGYRVALPTAPVYIVGDAGAFGDPIMGEGIYHAVESGRIAGETIADCVAGAATPATYYERLRTTVLRDTFFTYHVSKQFYRNPDKALSILENPLIWRAVVEGYARGETFTRSIAGAWWLLPKAVGSRQFTYARAGRDQPLALAGPFRGVPYLCEPFVQWAKQRLGLAQL